MGFNFSSFLAGAAKGAVDILEEDEKKASASATYGVKALKENYDKMMVENRKMESEVSENIKALRTFDSTATEAELFAAATNKTYMSMALEAAKTNPNSFKVGHVVKIIGDNESKTTAEEMLKYYTTIPSISETASKADTIIKESGGFLSNLRGGVAERAAAKARAQTAEALGVPIEKLQAASGYVRGELPVKAEFEMSAFQKQPANAKDIKDKLDVEEILAAQKFGENSPERLAAKKKKDFVESLDVKVDKTQDARAERLMLEKLDTKDPARIKEIDTDLKGIRESIKNHKKLTTIADPKEKEATYNAMKTDVSDYVNTRMRDAKGTKWRNMVEFKTFTDEATGKTITSKTTKVDMTPEQQQEMFAAERQLTAQALRSNGYVLPDGTPRTPVAERLMRNFNITANDLVVGASPPAAAAEPPVAQPTAQPTARPVPQLTRQDQEALVWANNPANAGPKAEAIKSKIEKKLK